MSGTATTTTTTTTPISSLTTLEKRNIVFLVLAFSGVVASLTLVVGSGAVIVQSVGGSTQIAPFSLALFFLGMSSISLTATHWIFQRWGRKKGFWVGQTLGLVGAGLGVLGCVQASPALVLISNVFLGAGAGMGMYLRFAAVEVLPPAYAARAISWTLCGGCLAAFAGPESGQALKERFGNDLHLTYVGTYLMTAVFFLLQAFFVGLVQFPETNEASAEQLEDQKSKSTTDMPTGETTDTEETERTNPTLLHLLRQPTFIIPLGTSIFTWSIMSLPMSILRVAMSDLGFTARQSLTVIEVHFLSMYAPGFVSGAFVKKHGPIRASWVGVTAFLIGIIIALFTPDNTNSLAPWFITFIFLGIGWNFGFSAATVWTTYTYAKASQWKAQVQAANEFATFLIAGGFIFSTGYLYALKDGIDGWRVLNGFVMGLVGVMALILLYASCTVSNNEEPTIQQQEQAKNTKDSQSSLEECA